MKADRKYHGWCGKRWLAALVIGAVSNVPASALAADSAVIIQYHRFGEANLPSTNITLEQFEAHLAHLQSGDYTVLPVPHIIAALRAGQPLPDKAIGITIDDAAKSVFREAWPRLREAGFPFTLFVSTDAVDQRRSNSMSWDEIRLLVETGVTIGNHGSAHGHMWKNGSEAARGDVMGAQERFQKELGFAPRFFAYPYGEYDLALRDLIEELGFEAAFGQNSGVAGKEADPFTLPRFSLNETYGSDKRFQLIIDTLPIPVRDVTPADPILTTNPPHIGFTVDESIDEVDELACYVSGTGSVQLEILGERRVELRMSKTFSRGRNRVNCTMPGPDQRWRWFGLQYLVP